MKKFETICLIFTLLLFFIFEKKTMAIGLGLDAKISTTVIDMDIIKDNYYIGAGGGFILDTAVAKNKLFNYRFGLTYTYQFYNADLSQFKLNNIFGFGVIRNKRLRFWLGPKIGISYIVGSMGSWENSTEISTGLVIGINVHLNRIISLTIQCENNIGLMSSWSMESQEGWGNPFSTYTINNNYIYYEADLKLGILFRIRDNY